MKILHIDQKSLDKVGEKGGEVSEEISNIKNIPNNLYWGSRKDAFRLSQELLNSPPPLFPCQYETDSDLLKFVFVFF